MALRRALALALGLLAVPGVADATGLLPPLTSSPPGPFKAAPDQPDVWIFSGVLKGNNETFSGTLISGKADTQFELKLADGATCDGSQLTGDIGLVRLSGVSCTDGRSMRALFVPQGGLALKVFGLVGEEHFATEAHLLGTEPPPEPKQTAQPTVPHVLPPSGPPSGLHR